MSNIVQQHIACPACPSSDAYVIYDSGWGHCFSCGVNIKEGDEDSTDRGVVRSGRRRRVSHGAGAVELIPTGEFVPLLKRKLKVETLRKYGYFVTEFNGRKVQVAPYHDDSGKVIAQKVRFPNKDFTVAGDLSSVPLFGAKLARRGGKRIAITEGEIDAMSLAQALNLSWPVVSIPNGAKGARKAIAENLEFLESYETVILCFDNDEAGQEAVEEVAELFTPGKVQIMSLSRKDANEMLVAGEVKELVKAFWEAKTYRPDGIVDGADTWDMVEQEVEFGKPYPWGGLNDFLYGRRGGEVVTWTAGTGTGKSAIVSEIAYHITQHDGEKVGYIALEESVRKSVQRFVGVHLNKPIHLPGFPTTVEERRKAWEETVGQGQIKFYDSFGSIQTEVLMAKMRYLVKALGVTTIILDHISIMVSGLETDNERKDLDIAMTAIRAFAQETGVNIQLVSHLKRVSGTSAEEGGQIGLQHLRGTQAIAQLSDAVIAAERDQQDDDPNNRDTTVLRVLKNRFAGTTGVACALKYDRKTGRLSEEPLEEGETSGPGQPTDDDDQIPF